MQANQQRIVDRIQAANPSISFEFFPPKSPAAETVLWDSIQRVEALAPTFVSITYGAGGTSREGTLRVTQRIASDTPLTPLGHLTCVGHSEAELQGLLDDYAAAGVRDILALRGDPSGGPGQPWIAHPEGYDHAIELVELARKHSDFCVGVAAFPDRHPEAVDLEADARVLVAKQRAGAEFAITQMFFDAPAYFELVERVERLGGDLPILAGLMPVTNLPQIERMAQLTGMPLPDKVLSRLHAVAHSPDDLRAVGIEMCTELAQELLSGGAPGLHFLTLNKSSATTTVCSNLGLGEQ